MIKILTPSFAIMTLLPGCKDHQSSIFESKVSSTFAMAYSGNSSERKVGSNGLASIMGGTVEVKNSQVYFNNSLAYSGAGSLDVRYEISSDKKTLFVNDKIVLEKNIH